jgi:hypothetical protein
VIEVELRWTVPVAIVLAATIYLVVVTPTPAIIWPSANV